MPNGVSVRDDLCYLSRFVLPASLVFFLLFSSQYVPSLSAHLAHLPHYNGGGLSIGRYYVYQAMEPEYTSTQEPAKIIFSIQDGNGNDIHDNILTMVEIYSEKTEERIAVYPWTSQNTGDFGLYYAFAAIGNYQIVLSISDANNTLVHVGGSDPPRGILSGNLGCHCERGVFNISVSNSFGTIFDSAVSAGIVGIILVFGIVLWFAYNNKKRNAALRTRESKSLLKHTILLLAMAAGFVHLAVYAEHGSLRIEYSIFLLAAGGAQFTYGILYTLLTVTSDTRSIGGDAKFIKVYYRKTVILNLFGFIGTGVLLGLYIYSVLLPPPLSPSNVPEDVDIAGLLDKSLELFLIIGIVLLMRWEKSQLRSRLVHVS
jgi:cbb3-type cytochrome oxidase subunit 3